MSHQDNIDKGTEIKQAPLPENIVALDKAIESIPEVVTEEYLQIGTASVPRSRLHKYAAFQSACIYHKLNPEFPSPIITNFGLPDSDALAMSIKAGNFKFPVGFLPHNIRCAPIADCKFAEDGTMIEGNFWVKPRDVKPTGKDAWKNKHLSKTVKCITSGSGEPYISPKSKLGKSLAKKNGLMDNGNVD